MDARLIIRGLLLLNAWHVEGGHRWVTRCEDDRLNPAFNPPDISIVAKELGGYYFTQAKPDTCIGYAPYFVSDPSSSTPFSEKQEDVIFAKYDSIPPWLPFRPPANQARRLRISDWVFFHFLTAEWELETGDKSAIPRGARDGAVIINHLRTLLVTTSQDADADELLVNASHVSITVDG
jgi:hypothetical protein